MARTGKARALLDHLGECWATFFFVGRLPKAPGTFGSLAALPFAWFLWTLPLPWAWFLAVLTFITGTAAASVVHKRTGVSDHQSIVIDEVVGIFVTTSVAAPQDWLHYFLAFLLFRLFDIWKPWPVSWIDRKWHSPVGTMMDDLVASLMSTGVLWLLIRFPPQLLLLQK